ncbi:MAG: hypothetical protein M3P32_08295 [Chloroflexota bacterium]|nr:hypothetical protein [Chloroflexota bacterium]
MPSKTAAQQDAMRRAEARRRSRLVAQGRLPDEEEKETEAVPARRPSGSFLQRLFPPAAPLAGKPLPLAGFAYTGRLRPIVLGGWLIRQNLFAGIGMGLLWAGSYILTVQEGRSIYGTIASFVSFGALVAAGWIGWRKPWFYGFVAAVIGYIVYAVYAVFAYSSDPISVPTSPNYVAPDQVATYLFTNGLLQAAIGALAGFYGGYLRRRLADPATRQAAAARQAENARRRR